MAIAIGSIRSFRVAVPNSQFSTVPTKLIQTVHRSCWLPYIVLKYGNSQKSVKPEVVCFSETDSDRNFVPTPFGPYEGPLSARIKIFRQTGSSLFLGNGKRKRLRSKAVASHVRSSNTGNRKIRSNRK